MPLAEQKFCQRIDVDKMADGMGGEPKSSPHDSLLFA